MVPLQKVSSQIIIFFMSAKAVNCLNSDLIYNNRKKKPVPSPGTQVKCSSHYDSSKTKRRKKITGKRRSGCFGGEEGVG